MIYFIYFDCKLFDFWFKNKLFQFTIISRSAINGYDLEALGGYRTIKGITFTWHKISLMLVFFGEVVKYHVIVVLLNLFNIRFNRFLLTQVTSKALNLTCKFLPCLDCAVFFLLKIWRYDLQNVHNRYANFGTISAHEIKIQVIKYYHCSSSSSKDIKINPIGVVKPPPLARFSKQSERNITKLLCWNWE